ncbi:MAG: hypothetical protein J5819_04210 [Eubacterium sp.]|nr:hypothetical protein [Eubacterium sp.]
MYYASFGILSMILGFIINHEYLWKRKNKTYTPAGKRYRAFLFAAMLYYVSDILWGYLYSTRIVPLVYADTVLYFLSMVLSVLMWTRFVVKYINATGLFGEILAFEGWAIFAFEILCLIVNFFNPIIFEFAWDGEYMPHYIRYITLAIQVALFLMASVYTIFCAAKSEGKLRIQNITIGVSGIVMSVFIVLQTLYPLLPFYAIGLCIGNCLIHVFVEEVVRIDRAIEMRELQKKADEERREIIKVKKKNITFNRIAESLAANYDIIYYVDTRDDSYIGYNSDYMRGQLEEQLSGDNFFEDAIRDTARIIVPEDQERLLTFLDRDYLLTALDVRKQFVADYRMLVDDKPQYTRLIARKSCSGEHFIIAVENVDAEVRQEKEQEKALKSEKQLARHDELTGTKNKTAYIELEQSVQDNLDKGV